MRSKTAYLSLFCALFCYAYANISIAQMSSNPTVAYINSEPYSYLNISKEGLRNLTGLDIHLLNLVFESIDSQPHYEEMSWHTILHKLKHGEIDVATGIVGNAALAQDVYLSASYRQQTDALYLRQKDMSRLRFASLKRLLTSPVMRELKIGVVKHQVYSDPIINAYLAHPTYPKNIIYVDNNVMNINKLINREIDLFFADKIGTENFIWQHHLRHQIGSQNIKISSAPVYIAFSKKTITPNDVAVFNKKINDLRLSGKFQEIIQRHLVPKMIAITTETRWYHLAEIFGVISFAISGMLLARRVQYDFAGTLIIATLPASAGGIMRDVMLDRQPIGVLRTPLYVMVVFTTVLVGFALIRCYSFLKKQPLYRLLRRKMIWHKLPPVTYWVKYTDVFAQSSFVVTGVMVAVEAHATPLWLWGPVFATLSSCGGGVMRDFLIGSGFNRSYLFETLFAWGFLLSAFIIWRTEHLSFQEVLLAVVITMLGLITTRIAILHNGWRSHDFWNATTKDSK